MYRMLFLFLITGCSTHAQLYKIDTLQNTGAYINSFLLLQFSGTANNGDYYTAGFNQYYSESGKAQEVELVRIDLNTKKVQYKRLPGVLSGKGFFWTYVFDRNGNVYLSMNTNNRKIILLNLMDSIEFTDLGNPFINGTALAYSASLGRDGNLYFGGSSGGTYWSVYNTASKTFEKHPAVDPNNDYVLSIAGDSDFVYMQVGQKKSINLWSVNKYTNEKKILFTVPNTTRISLRVYNDGIYAGVGVDTLTATFRLEHGHAVKVTRIPPSPVAQPGKNENINKKNVTTAFDAASAQLFFSFGNNGFDSVIIKANSIQTGIRRIFSFPNDKENIYYAGDYYGNYYRYNLKEKKSYLLGSTGYNVYSFLPLNDSMIYMSGYPSGYIMLWNRNKPWTTQKFLNGKIIDAKDALANPRLLHYWKSEGTPAAGFHHTYQMVMDNKGNIIGAGDVIRIDNAASIGVYNAAANKIYGIEYKPYESFTFSGIALWNNLVVYAMRGNSIKKPKLFFYKPDENIMTDSIDMGFDDYGKIYLQQNILTGFANNRIYSYDLKKRNLLLNYAFNNNSIGGSFLLHNGKWVVNTANKIPVELSNVVALPFNNFHEANNILYCISGKYLLRINLNQ
jgi:hypothetical protein